MNRAFVVGADAPNPRGASALRIGANLFEPVTQTESVRAARDIAAPAFAKAAVSVGGWTVEKTHG